MWGNSLISSVTKVILKRKLAWEKDGICEWTACVELHFSGEYGPPGAL